MYICGFQIPIGVLFGSIFCISGIEGTSQFLVGSTDIEVCRPSNFLIAYKYLKGHGDLVSRLVIGISGAI